MQTPELFRELKKKGFFKGYGNKAEMACGRIIAYIEVDCKDVGTVTISMQDANTLLLSFLSSSTYFEEKSVVGSVDDCIAKFQGFIKSPNIRQ